MVFGLYAFLVLLPVTLGGRCFLPLPPGYSLGSARDDTSIRRIILHFSELQGGMTDQKI